MYFLKAMTADRFFRVDRGQEKLQFITDVHTEDIYILDPEMRPQMQVGTLWTCQQGVGVGG